MVTWNIVTEKLGEAMGVVSAILLSGSHEVTLLLKFILDVCLLENASLNKTNETKK